MGKAEGKRPIGRSGLIWVDNTKIDLRETGLNHMDWIHLSQSGDQLEGTVNTVMNFRVRKMLGNS
jgi:hypothetical protein